MPLVLMTAAATKTPDWNTPTGPTAAIGPPVRSTDIRDRQGGLGAAPSAHYSGK
jgi:hypothetical protein